LNSEHRAVARCDGVPIGAGANEFSFSPSLTPPEHVLAGGGRVKARVNSPLGEGERPEAERACPGQGEAPLIAGWRPEPVSRAILWDELGQGVKG
jgi:hypothetical protein